jgi:hypothetical protein
MGSAINQFKFIASGGVKGWYTTIVDNELIDFVNEEQVNGVNSIIIHAGYDDLAIKINGCEDLWYIDAWKKDGIDGLGIKTIQIMNPKGTKIKWKALGY